MKKQLNQIKSSFEAAWLKDEEIKIFVSQNEDDSFTILALEITDLNAVILMKLTLKESKEIPDTVIIFEEEFYPSLASNPESRTDNFLRLLNKKKVIRLTTNKVHNI